MTGSQARRGLRALAVVALAVAACGGGASPSPSSAAPAGGSVAVTLQEWAVVPAASSVAAGDVTFTVTNSGPDDIHEFVVLKTDLAAGALPVDENGAVTEGGEGIEIIGEIEDIPVGETQELEVPLQAGKYVLVCNIWSEEEQEAHYQEGMRTEFTVN